MKTNQLAERKQQFISELAHFLVDNQAAKGIQLQVEATRTPHGLDALRPKMATEWAKLRSLSPLMGYPTVEEAEQQLTSFFA